MTDTTEDMNYEAEEIKKPVKEMPVVVDTGVFQHDTGDRYEGMFEIKKKDRTARMHGPGVYTTAEGDVYSGTWEADRLLSTAEDVSVTFVDGSKYEGQFRDWSYAGRGQYTYPDGSVVACEFVDNCPTGTLSLTDPNEHVWLGQAESGFGWFDPVNHFYQKLEKPRESRSGAPKPKINGNKEEA